MDSTLYLLDANVFIQAKNQLYPPDIFPGFWDWLQNSAGKVVIIDKVKKEILKGKDDLASFIKGLPESFFRKTDNSVTEVFHEINDFLNKSKKIYKRSAISSFGYSTDYYLIAHAKKSKCTVVTQEVSAIPNVRSKPPKPNVKSKPSNPMKKIKIPDVCKGLDVECINIIAMLRRERVKFVLDQDEEED